MTREKQTVRFYPPAKEKMVEIWGYSSQWGKDHADSYVATLYEAIKQQKNADRHKPFPKVKITDLVNEPIYFFLWRYKSRTPVHTVFYRILSDKNIGVIEIAGPGQQKSDRLRDAVEKVQPLIERENKQGRSGS